MTRPRDPLRPPLAGNELVGNDETGVVQQLDVVMECLEILAVFASPAYIRAAAFEVQQNAAEKIDVSFHGAWRTSPPTIV